MQVTEPRAHCIGPREGARTRCPLKALGLGGHCGFVCSPPRLCPDRRPWFSSRHSTWHPGNHDTASNPSKIKRLLFYSNMKILFYGVESKESGHLSDILSIIIL